MYVTAYVAMCVTMYAMYVAMCVTMYALYVAMCVAMYRSTSPRFGRPPDVDDITPSPVHYYP